MPLSPWYLVAAYLPPTLIFAYIVYRYNRHLYPVLIVPGVIALLYGWIGVVVPEASLIPRVARYVLLFTGGWFTWVSLEYLSVYMWGKKSGL